MNTTGAGFNIRVLPSEQIFSAKSTVIIPEDRKDTLVLCGLLNSRLLRWFLYQQGAGLAGNTGKIKKLPIIWPTGKLERDLASLTREAIETMAALESFRDTSPCFIDCVRSHEQFVEQYRNVADRLDSTVSQLYGEEPHEEAVKATEELVDAAVSEATGGLADPAARSRSLLVFCLGVLFGRWDIRIALDSSELAGSRDPFAPLPACPPGMLQDERGLPAFPTDVPAEYPLRISWPGVLVDDDGHPDDIATRIRETIGAICGERAEAIEQEACDILSLRELREFFRRPAAFFSDHLKRYTRSRRVAPIYWPLSTASGSYTLWLYYQRLTNQTLYTCVNNFVDPKLKQVEEDSSRLRTKSDRSSSDEKELERLSDLAQDLKEFREELLRIAGFWRPNLNDGVQITAAPLWRLFQHKPWQKKLKDTWSKLESGDYDWAHLALSIWPERVTKKSCREDRSIAIAHDLEDELWEEVEVEKRTRGGKVKKVKEWRPKELSEDELDSIVKKVKARKQ